MATKRDEVEKILSDVRRLIELGHPHHVFVYRRKNLAFLQKHGMTLDDVITAVTELEVEDFSTGPSDDRNLGDRRCIWCFGSQVHGDEVYIKIKVYDGAATTISFHEAEYPINYPFRKECR